VVWGHDWGLGLHGKEGRSLYPAAARIAAMQWGSLDGGVQGPEQFVASGPFLLNNSFNTFYTRFPFAVVLGFFHQALGWLASTIPRSDSWNHGLPFPQVFQNQQSCKCWGSAAGVGEERRKLEGDGQKTAEILLCTLKIISCFHTPGGQPSLKTAFDLNWTT